MKQKVLIVEPIHPRGLAVFDDRFEVKMAANPSVANLCLEIRGVAGVVLRTSPFPREIIEAADSLKVIARHGVGVDNIDLAAATEKGILVVNTPNANANSVAEHTILAMGALAKRLIYLDRATRAVNWKAGNEYGGIDLEGKTLGVIGLGRVGSRVAKKAMAAFEMRVIACDPYIDPAIARELGVTLYADRAEIFRRADVVSLHTPSTPETRGMVDEAALRMMKPSAFLLNFARGGIVDEKALYHALNEHVIAAAAIDVFDPEPPRPDNPLFALENVLLSPHSAALTQECAIRMATGAAQGVVEVLSGQKPQFPVNLEALKGV